MTARRVIAVLILAIPFAVLGWIVGVMGLASSTLIVESASYPETKRADLPKMEKAQLSRALEDAINKAEDMKALWADAKSSYESLLYALLGIITLLCVALAALLWRAPPA
jgi:hypothetical protein